MLDQVKGLGVIGMHEGAVDQHNRKACQDQCYQGCDGADNECLPHSEPPFIAGLT
jgi:hypothetical protein